jgi:hypothetical protein
MKSKFLICFSISCWCTLIYLSSCGGKSDPSPQDQVRSILTSGTWNLQGTTVDGVDQSSVYTGLTLRFTDTNFTSTNGRVIWPASGTWQFADESGETFVRNDAVVVTIENATSSNLVLRLTWNETTLGNGRVASVAGVNVFTFTK